MRFSWRSPKSNNRRRNRRLPALTQPGNNFRSCLKRNHATAVRSPASPMTPAASAKTAQRPVKSPGFSFGCQLLKYVLDVNAARETSAPSLTRTHRSRCPLLSINVTSLKSMIPGRTCSVRWFFLQLALSSRTHGAVSRPCKIHLSSAGVSLRLIFNMDVFL